MGFSRQEYWSGVPLPSPDLPAVKVKLFTTDWYLNPHGWDLNPVKILFGTLTHVAGNQTQPKSTVPHFSTLRKFGFLMSPHRKNLVRGKVMDKKGFIRIGHLWGLQEASKRVPHPENLVGYSFIIKGKVRRGERPLSSSFLSRCQISIISSSSSLGRGVFLSLCCQARMVMALWKNHFRS